MKTILCHCLYIIMFLQFLFMPAATHAQHYVPAKNSTIEFRVYNHKQGNDLARGLFTEIHGDILFDPKKLEKSSFDVTVNAAGVSTGNADVNKSLQSASFLSALLYPKIRIRSTRVTSDGGVIYILQGDLTLKGITKPVSIQFTATPIGSGYLFRGSFRINRLLYNVGEKGDIDDMVTLFIELKTEKK